MIRPLLKSLSLSLMVLASTTGILAQASSMPTKGLNKFATLQSSTTKVATNKINALNSRGIGYSYSEWSGGAWVITDSSNYSYTGTRGGDGESDLGWEFDTNYNFTLNGSTLENSEWNVRTYDALNRPLTQTYKGWNGLSWQNDSRITVTYAATGGFADFTQESWTGSAWLFTDRTTYTYDANGNQLTSQDDTWTAGAWVPTGRFTSTYDANSNTLTEINEDYNGGWLFTQRFSYTYDANSNKLTETSDDWVAAAWAPQNKTTNTYNASNLQLTTLVQYYSGGAWVNQSLSTNTYDIPNNTITTIDQQFINNVWEDTRKTVVVRNAGYTSQTLTGYYWSGSAWAESNQEVTTYNADTMATLQVNSTWDMGAWVVQNNETNTYNGFKQPTSSVRQSDNGAGLENQDRKLYYYETYEDGTGITELPSLSSNVLPNPFTANVAIQLTITQASNHTFEVYNMAGQRVYTESRQLTPGLQTIVWEGQEAPTGVYFYKVFSQNGVASGKLIKQ